MSTATTTIRVTGIARDRKRATTFDSVRPTMIRMTVKEIAGREGIENPNALSEATGLPYETCRRLWQGTPSKIGLNTIERLCDVLHVRPGQLFDYEFEPDKPKPKNSARGKR
jgi:DNA-binding Xre family transcriptional regulator